jgi:uncharacterized C2H2 Zn-finger protein
MEQLESGYWRCNICNQEVQYRHSLQRHIESKHMHCEPIACPYCDRSFNTKNSIQTHISKYHRQKRPEEVSIKVENQKESC